MKQFNKTYHQEKNQKTSQTHSRYNNLDKYLELNNDVPRPVKIKIIRICFQNRECTKQTWGESDEQIIAAWLNAGAAFKDILKVILLGCARMYSIWRNEGNYRKIFSPNYFIGNFDELKKLDDFYFRKLVHPKIVKAEAEFLKTGKLSKRS